MTSLFESIAAMPVPFNMVVMVVFIGSVAGLIGTLAKEVRQYLCHQAEMEFEREMVARGMKSHEIEQVMQAKLPDIK